MNRIRTLVLSGVVLAAILVGSALPAMADKLPVRVTSKPVGATLYLDSRDSEPIGKTPFAGALPEGTYTLIVELDGHEASVQTIRVRRKKGNRPLSFSAELEKVQSAVLSIMPVKADSAANGARVLVDGVEQGNVPDKITVPAGPHQVEVIKEGYRTFEVWIEPGEGDELPIEVALEPDGSGKKGDGKKGDGKKGDGKKGDGKGDDERVAAGTEDDDAIDDDEVEDDDDGGEIEIEVEPGAAARGPFIVIGLGLELGSRTFTYVDNTSERPYNAGGVPMGRMTVELYPLASLGKPALAGLGIAAGFARAAPLDSTTSDGQKISTAWSEFDVAGRYQYGFGSGHHAALEVGLGGQTFDFTVPPDASMLDETNLPEVSYRFLRFGLDGKARVGDHFAVYGRGSYRQIRSVGALADNYDTSTVTSFAVGLGLGYAVTPAIEARLDGCLQRYGFAFSAGRAGFTATSGTDQFLGFGLGAAFRY